MSNRVFEGVATISLAKTKGSNNVAFDKNGIPNVRLTPLRGLVPNRFTISGSLAESQGLIKLNGESGQYEVVVSKGIFVYTDKGTKTKDNDGKEFCDFSINMDDDLTNVGLLEKRQVQAAFPSLRIIDADSDEMVTVPDPTEADVSGE